MTIDRKWIVLTTLTILLLLPACSGKKAPDVEPPPPKPVEQAPTTEVPARAEPAEPVDEQEPVRPKSLADLQDEFYKSGLLGDIFFGFDRYDLDASARERLAKNAEFMNSPDGRSLTFTVEGHCDERGTNEYNIALGQNRSSASVDYLISLGVSGNRFKTISYGEERPFCTESTEACWQKNRRARFVLNGR